MTQMQTPLKFCLAPRMFSLWGVWPIMVVVAFGAVPAPAHAGMFQWVDQMFTFREDQKERVAPRRVLPPMEVYVPYYPVDDHKAWSDYYTRTDLTAQPYLEGSTSKVMRPPAEPVQQPMAAAPTAMGGMTGNGAPTTAGQGYVPGSWAAQAQGPVVQNGGAGGMASGGPSVMIGDPVEDMIGAPMAMGGPGDTANIGRGTMIGAPVESWRNGGGSRSGFASRPGDFDYSAPAKTAIEVAGPAIAGRSVEDVVGGDSFGGRTSIATVGGTPSNPAWRNDPRYTDFNAKGQVTRYKVQTGDTLSGIAGQEAIYDNWKLWPLIYSANRKAIGHNPANLKREQQLGIPRDYTDGQARAAEKRAGRR